MSATSRSWRKTLPLDPQAERNPRNETNAHEREHYRRIRLEGNQRDGGHHHTEARTDEGSLGRPIPLASRRHTQGGRQQWDRKEEQRVHPKHGANPDPEEAGGRRPQQRISQQPRHWPDPNRAHSSRTD